MKKAFVVLVVLVLGVGAVGCGNVNNSNPASPTPTSTPENMITAQVNIGQKDYSLTGTYSGELKDGVPEGQGKFVAAISESNWVGCDMTFEGQWKAGKFISGVSYAPTIGKVIHSYKNGICVSDTYYADDGTTVQKVDTYDTNGKLKSSESYTNGVISSKTNYKDGKTVSTTNYDSSGNPVS